MIVFQKVLTFCCLCEFHVHSCCTDKYGSHHSQ